MKKESISVLAALVLMSGGTAHAAEYNTVTNSVTDITGNTYQTIMIVKYDEENNEYDYNNIVYIDESQDGLFSSSAQFLLKNSPEAGKYAVLMGANGMIDKLEFYIGVESWYADTKSDHDWQDGDTVSFAWDALELSEYNSVILISGSDIYCVSLNDFTRPVYTSGDISVGLQLTGVPEGMEINAYLSKASPDFTTLDMSSFYINGKRIFVDSIQELEEEFAIKQIDANEITDFKF